MPSTWSHSRLYQTNALLFNRVNYWQTPRAKRSPTIPRWNQACFGRMDWAGSRAITYIAPVADCITEQHVRFWIRCLRHWLTHLKWNARILRVRDAAGADKLCVLYKLREMGFSRPKALLYLTAFRYVANRNPQLIKSLFDARESFETPADAFRAMQAHHYKAHPQGDMYRFENGETLICRKQYYGTSADAPIELSQFQVNLLNDQIASVQRHFA